MSTSPPPGRITRRLSAASPALFSAYAIGAAFSCYFCMYAFRKPYTVGLFEGEGVAGIDYKMSLILAQLFGYTLSKFIGIKVISEMSARGRGLALLGLIGVAELSLVLFALAPPSWGPLFLFLNGIPLGMVWGLVFAFLEGRQLTELLGAGLSASYIIASGFVKSAGSAVMNGWEVSERWMPAVTGLLFLLPFMICVFLLQQLPAPSAADEAARMRRLPMDRAARGDFLRRFAPGLPAVAVTNRRTPPAPRCTPALRTEPHRVGLPAPGVRVGGG